MSEMNAQLRVPTVNDLRVKLCYICREEERYDSPPDPPPVWTHPCKCTLVAHESCLLHWIKTQQRDLGRARDALKCPQCGDSYEIEGFNPTILRILDFVNRTLSRSGRIVTACCACTIVLSFGAGIYFTCTTYGAFAVRELIGPELFRNLLTSNPTNWPWHAWVNLPLIPLTLIASRTSLVLWTTSPLVPLLFPWPSSAPVAHAFRLAQSQRPQLWPPPPALVCALFPVIRTLYTRLRARVTNAIVKSTIPRPQPQNQEEENREQERQGLGGGAVGAAQAFEFQIHEHFDLEIRTRIRMAAVNPPAPLPAPAPAAADAGGAAGAEVADIPEGERAQEELRAPEGQRQPPQDQQGQQQEGQEQQPEQQQQPWVEQQQEQQVAQLPWGDEDLAAVAARTIRVTGSSLGRLVGGALAMPTISRIMGSFLLRLSHVFPLIRAIIAPRPPRTGGGGGLLGLFGASGGVPAIRLFGAQGEPTGFGARVLSGLSLITTHEWATSDPVWWRNILGLGMFIVVKDGLKILHLRLAKKELEERHIKNKSFAGVDLAGLDLIDRSRYEQK
ncbi:hypothetical protein B0F90DRAFT_1818678 [Multifurca ochricompacta]|uniref:RING-CH-type domain-containing protein n=1 Tax=Multifurca ochricompacta TaxID=376703 RepID=A0AAD4QMC6_9AGAM|nr:hypothetical protein B0F90DRAFT_1818678 [Multifurca ochricompacta]